eukprot:3533055-Amphidinium_carterae.1
MGWIHAYLRALLEQTTAVCWSVRVSTHCTKEGYQVQGVVLDLLQGQHKAPGHPSLLPVCTLMQTDSVKSKK